MIVTLTANPSLDRTVELDDPLARGAVQRARATRDDPGGKGVNVTRALLASGVASLALLPGREDDPYFTDLAAEHVPARTVPIDGRIRANLTLVERDGTTTKVNEPGPLLAPESQAALIDLVIDAVDGADWLVLAGSLPQGVAADFYVRVVVAVRAGVARPPRIAVDTSGAPLAALIAAELGIDLIKPNAEELAELLGSSSEAALEADPESAARLARTLRPEQARASLVTLGAVGAVLVTERGAWFASAPKIVPQSSVGAGDCSLAGYLIASQEGADPAVALGHAVAYGAAAASLPGSVVPTRGGVDPSRITVTPLVGIVAVES